MDIDGTGLLGEDDVMEYEEADPSAPSAGIPIEADESLGQLLLDDEVMGNEATTAGELDMPVEGEDIDLEGVEGEEEEEEDGDGMEPEPTPLFGTGGEGAKGANPFSFAGTGGGLAAPDFEDIEVGEAEAVGEEHVEGIETREEGGEGEGSRDVQVGATANPLPIASATSTVPGSGGVVDGDSNLIPSPSLPLTQPSSIAPPPATQNAVSEAPIPLAEPTGNADDYVGEDEEEYYEEDEEAGDEAQQPTSAAVLSTGQPHPAPTSGVTAEAAQVGGDDDNGELENDEDLGDEDAQDEMLTVNTQPGIILHLPDHLPTSLFFPLDPAEGLPDGITAANPVWFADRHAELAQVPLTKLLEAVRELADGDAYHKGRELILDEHGLGVKLCEDDRHLDGVTLLEFLQVHHSCGLPTPVQFHVSFGPRRFWDRFDAIRKELVHIAERKRLGLSEEPDEDEDEFGEEEVSDGYDSEVEMGQSAAGYAERRSGRAPVEQDEAARAQYAGSEQEVRREKRGEAESAHPNADWARNLATAPMAFGIGNIASANPRSRESSQPVVTPHDDDVALPPPSQNKGRSSRKDDIADLADTTEASSTDSRTVKAKMDAPIDEIPGEEDGYDDEDGEVPAPSDVPLDEIALKEERDAAVDDDDGVELEASKEDEGGASYDAELQALGLSSREETLPGGEPMGDVKKGKADGTVPGTVASLEPSQRGDSTLLDMPETPASTQPDVVTPFEPEATLKDRLQAIDEMGDDEVDALVAGDETGAEVEGDTEAYDGEEGAEDEVDEGYFEGDETEEDGAVPVTNQAALKAYVDGRIEEGEEPKDPLLDAVQRGDLPMEVAEDVAGKEAFDKKYHDDEGFVVGDDGDDYQTQDDEPVDPFTRSTGDESLSVLTNKRSAPDDEPLSSGKRSRQGDN